MKAVVAAFLLVACGSTASAPIAKPQPITEAPDGKLAEWRAIAASKDKAGEVTRVGELVAYLASPDPERRDAIAFEILAAWIGDRRLDDDAIHALVKQLLAGMGGDLAERDGVFRRSFSALVLGEIVRRDRKTPVLTPDERSAILAAALAYAERETDLRGHTGKTGWAHAAAHTADLLARIALLPTTTDADRATILDAVERFTTRRHGQIFAYGEDGRLAAPVVLAVRGGVPAGTIDAWVAKLRAPLAEPPQREFDPALFAAQRNARNLVFTLYVQLDVADATSPGEQALLAALRKLITE